MVYISSILLLILCFVQSSICSTPVNNYDGMQVVAKKSAQSIGKYLKERNIDTCILSISHHPARILLKSSLAELTTVHFYSDLTTNNKVEIEILDFAVRYYRYSESTDSVVREFVIRTSGILQSSSEQLNSIPEFTATLRDTISRNDISMVESPEYVFTKSIIPSQEKSLLSEIAEPIILFSVAAISVLLLFSIRSQ